MPIISTCVHCGEAFSKPPALHRHAQRRGSEIKFCSRRCTDAARSAGTIGAKKRRGVTLTCEVCSSAFYRTQSASKRNFRFCSEPCRQEAYRRGMIDRSGPRPNRLLGEMIECMFCGAAVYRKRSMLDRNIGKTCGSPACVSAYGRSLWGLSPREERRVRQPKHLRKYRRDNFSAAQRREWLGDRCTYCGTTENLTLDHIIPVAAGGKAVKENAQTLCGPCNNWKAVHVDRKLTLELAPKGGSVS